MQMIFISIVILVFRNITAAYRVDLYVIDVNFNLLDCLEFEGHVLHCPIVATAFHGGLDDKRMSNGLLAGAFPNLVTSQQHFLQIVDVECSTSAVAVVSGHRHDVVRVGRIVVDHNRQVIAWWWWWL